MQSVQCKTCELVLASAGLMHMLLTACMHPVIAICESSRCRPDLIELFHMVPPQLKFRVDSIAAGSHTVCIRPSCQSLVGVAAAGRQGITCDMIYTC